MRQCNGSLRLSSTGDYLKKSCLRLYSLFTINRKLRRLVDAPSQMIADDREGH